MKYRDLDGMEVDAEQLTAPCILNTLLGECAAEPGSWLVTSESFDRPIIFSDAAFAASFTLAE